MRVARWISRLRSQALIAALTGALAAAPASATLCGPDPVMEMFSVVAEDGGAAARSIERAAKLTVDHFLNKGMLLFAGQFSGVECKEGSSRFRVVDVVWLIGPMSGPDEAVAIGMSKRPGPCVTPEPTEFGSIQLVLADAPDEGQVSAGAQFSLDACWTVSVDFEKCPEHVRQNFSALKREFDTRAAEQRERAIVESAWRAKHPVFQRR